MDWLLKFTVIWLSIDILIFASSWYAVTVIKPRWPNWWKRVVVDVDPEFNTFWKQENREFHALRSLFEIEKGNDIA